MVASSPEVTLGSSPTRRSARSGGERARRWSSTTRSLTLSVSAQTRDVDAEEPADSSRTAGKARVLLLMRGWHPELEPEERAALRELVRRGGEELPAGYEALPISPGVFAL
ncbi:unnamed protein product [Prorocentrum cordatum]|uniref:Uncharacterized protein n=1 Tax=Prorocentrum cordatum TaxID=2364126 RepID=A0ABN9PR05_9DINO|nr:unnamed protein product [Polarella glacialis]